MIELWIPQDQIAAALTPGVLDILTIIPVDQIADKVLNSYYLINICIWSTDIIFV